MGHAWETVFDIISLFTSAVEVCVNPADPMAWLKKRGYKMELKVSGTKRAVHEWQHDMIEGYIAVAGHRPKINFSSW